MFCKREVLDNGLTIITEKIDGASSASLGFWVRVGSRDECLDVGGMSHFMEHMLFKGTKSRSSTDISNAFDGIGAELNAFTSKEYTCFYSRMIASHFEDAFEILADMILNPSFNQSDVELEREVVIEEIARCEDTPDEYVFDLFNEAYYGANSLGRPILGKREIVGSFKSSDLKTFHNKHYNTGNISIVACGAIDHEQTVTLANKFLSDMNVGETQLRPSSIEINPASLVALQKETEQAHIVIGFDAVCANDKRRFAYSILSCALGGGMSSRLFNEIREKRGLVYAVYSSLMLSESSGFFYTYAGTRPENISEVIDVTKSEFAKVLKEPICGEEFNRAKEYLCGHYALSMESIKMHMIRLGELSSRNMPLVSVEETLEQYRSCTQKDIEEIANEMLTEDPCIAIISPYKQSEIEEMI